MVKHLIDWKDWDSKPIKEMLELGMEIKKHPENYSQELKHKSLIMLFEKTSTRTRLSFEIGMTKLGGHAVFFDSKASNMGITDIKIEATVMSRYADFIMARLLKNQTLMRIAEGSRVPVINALCEKYHPCQALADYMTVKEKVGDFSKARMIYTGIANNVSNSLVSCGTKLGCEVYLVCPEKDPDAVDPAMEKAATATGLYHEVKTLKEALNTDKTCFVYTDTWVNLEFFSKPEFAAEKERRLKTFMPFQVSQENIKKAKKKDDPYAMHCLPVHLGYEMSDDMVPEKYPKNIWYDQAENRLWAQMGILVWLNKNK